MDFFGRPLVCWNAIFSSCPFAQIEQLTAIAAKRAVGIAAVFGFFFASRTLHGLCNPCNPRLNDSSDQVVIQTLGNLNRVEPAGLDLLIPDVID